MQNKSLQSSQGFLLCAFKYIERQRIQNSKGTKECYFAWYNWQQRFNATVKILGCKYTETANAPFSFPDDPLVRASPSAGLRLSRAARAARVRNSASLLHLYLFLSSTVNRVEYSTHSFDAYLRLTSPRFSSKDRSILLLMIKFIFINPYL